MAPGRTERPSQRGKGAANRHARAARPHGTPEPHDGRAAKATPTPRGRGGGSSGRGSSSGRGNSSVRGSSAGRGGSAGRGSGSAGRGSGSAGRGGSTGPADGNGPGPRRYAKMPSSKRVPSRGEAWQVGEGPQKPDLGCLSLFETGTCADATVICRDRQWSVHKATLISRSTWFYQAMANAGPVVNPTCNLSNDYDPDDVDVLLRTIYANRLPEQYFNPSNNDSSLALLVKFFNMGIFLGVDAMRDDALTLLGRLCDRELENICKFDRSLSDVKGVQQPGKRVDTTDVCLALHEAFLKYSPGHGDLRAQCLLANYVFAGRSIFLDDENVRLLVDNTVTIAAAIFHASLGRDLAGWLPNGKLIHERHFHFDHSKKTQHPERCELCDETFDAGKRKRAMYDPYKVVMRPAGYCASCVDKADEDPESIFRKKGKSDRDSAVAAEDVRIKNEPV